MDLLEYPICIDPVSSFISVKLATGSPPHYRFQHLQRISVVVANRALTVNHEHCHFFGNHEDISKATFILAFSASGSLASIYQRSRRAWLTQDIPEEIAGRAHDRPSVRFVFATGEDQTTFLRLLSRMETAVQHQTRPEARDSYALVEILLRSPCAPRQLPVALEQPPVQSPGQ